MPRRDVFPSQLIYSLYINHPNKKRASCVLHCKEFKLMSIKCIFSYTNQEVVQNIYRGRKAGQTGGHCSDEKCTLMKYIGPEAPMVPLTNTQPHTVNMFDLLKGKHNSVGFLTGWRDLQFVHGGWGHNFSHQHFIYLQHVRGGAEISRANKPQLGNSVARACLFIVFQAFWTCCMMLCSFEMKTRHQRGRLQFYIMGQLQSLWNDVVCVRPSHPDVTYDKITVEVTCSS